jgi:hemolysin activation/secretion protein
MDKFKVINILIFIFFFSSFCFAQPQTATIQRNQELLQQEKLLRERIQKPKKVYIKEIIIEGISSINLKEIEESVLPFKKRWLSEEEINQIITSIKEIYFQKGFLKPTINYIIQKKYLIIKVIENKKD